MADCAGRSAGVGRAAGGPRPAVDMHGAVPEHLVITPPRGNGRPLSAPDGRNEDGPDLADPSRSFRRGDRRTAVQDGELSAQAMKKSLALTVVPASTRANRIWPPAPVPSES